MKKEKEKPSNTKKFIKKEKRQDKENCKQKYILLLSYFLFYLIFLYFITNIFREEDEIERKKEMQSLEKPPEPEENDLMIKPPSPEKEIPEPEEEQEDEKKNQKWNIIFQNEVPISKNPNEQIKNENPSISLDLKKKMDIEKGALPTNSQTANAFTIEVFRNFYYLLICF